MKKTILLLIGAFLLASSASAGIRGSAHDFSASTESGEICVLCHTPHGADIMVTNAPLWNHEITTTVTFKPYDNTDATQQSTPGQPNGISKLCLSCHDNTVAIDAFGGSGGTVSDIIANYDLGGTRTVGYANLGTDLSDDHPIGIDYQEAIDKGDADLRPTSTTIAGIGEIADILFNDKLECSSCHDVHNSYGNKSLLLVDNAGSALCLTCHAK